MALLLGFRVRLSDGIEIESFKLDVGFGAVAAGLWYFASGAWVPQSPEP